MTTAFDNPELFHALFRSSVKISGCKKLDWRTQKFFISFKVDGAYERMSITKNTVHADEEYMDIEFYIPYMFKFTCRFALKKGNLDPSVPFVSSELKLINKTTIEDAEHYLTMARLTT